MENQQLEEILLRMEKNSRKQVGLARAQCFFTVICAVCLVSILVLVLLAIPRINALIDQSQELMLQAVDVMNNLEETASTLSQLDLSALMEDITQLVENVNTLVTTSQEGMNETFAKINKIDFDGLNRSISELTSVIDALKKFVNNFKW